MEALNEINVTPLIDLAFALLIIFMIATPLLEQTIPIELPLESAKSQNDSKEPIQLIHINAKGDFYWGNQKVSDIEMDQKLEALSTQSTQPILRVRADRSLKYGRVIQLVDLIKKNKLSKISLDTVVQK
tara:strand:- start:866 stop:1252 length:387 start_codon:yes stop_codon:yes gene_type:complete